MAKKENTPQSITEPLHIKFRRQQRLADLAISRMTGKKLQFNNMVQKNQQKRNSNKKSGFTIIFGCRHMIRE